MEKKGFMSRLRILSKPTGKPQWEQAVKTIFLMVLAAIIAKFLGFDDGIQAIMFITLIATIIIDLPFPLRKVVSMAIMGLLITILAFISSSLALSSLPIFLLFTVLWSFFSLSVYIFGETSGSFGFIMFCGYFLSVILVNRNVSPLDWGLYIILAYLVASILFIPKIINRKKDISKMVASPYMMETSLEQVLSMRQALSGVPLDEKDYELFRVGNYLSGFRGYSKLLISRLSGESHETFQSFIDTANKISSQIAAGIMNKPYSLELESIEDAIANIQKDMDVTEQTLNAVLDSAHNIRDLLVRAGGMLTEEHKSPKKLEITSPWNSLREVLDANFNLNNMYIRHALRFTLAMTIGLLVVYLTHDRDAIWITMGIFIIIKPDVTSTINNMIVRVSFNVVAILLAIALGFMFPHQILFWIAFLMLFLFRAFYPSYMGLSVMTLTVFIVLIWPTGTVLENALARIIDISLGAIIALICAYLILPSRVKVNLPEQIARTIRANRKYAGYVIPSIDMDYNHDNAVSSFKKYMLEEKNLESAIKKVEDTFNDVEDDLAIYNELSAINRKLAADISAMALLIESNTHIPDISRFKEQLTNSLNELTLSVNKNVILPKASIDTIYFYSEEVKVPENLENYLNWIISDIKYLQEEVELASRSGALKRYRNVT